MRSYKVALSASFRDNPAVSNALDSCAHIYTTQVERYKEIKQQFPYAEVHVIPNATHSMMKCIRDWYEFDDVEFLTFNDLMQLRDAATSN
jgi:thymidylate synthase